MLGLRTQGDLGDKGFCLFFELVQNAASDKGCVFFLAYNPGDVTWRIASHDQRFRIGKSRGAACMRLHPCSFAACQLDEVGGFRLGPCELHDVLNSHM